MLFAAALGRAVYRKGANHPQRCVLMPGTFWHFSKWRLISSGRLDLTLDLRCFQSGREALLNSPMAGHPPFQLHRAVCATSSRSCGARHPCRGFTRLPASECLSLAWPRERHQREGHPGAAVSGHPALRLRNATTGFGDSPSMDCRRTPQQYRAPGAQGLCARRDRGVAFSLLTFSWPLKRK